MDNGVGCPYERLARINARYHVDNVVARTRTGVGRAIATYALPIEDRDEWVAAARRLA